MQLTHWKQPFTLFLTGILASLGQTAQATEPADQLAQVVRGCQYGDFPNYYSRVTTNKGDPLRIRNTPAGKTIGSVPNGWAVVVLEWSRNGVWARITSHFGDVGEFPFASAESFRDGWVAAAYLKDLGRFCDKPEAVGQLVQPAVFGEQPIEVQGDWLALGDALAETTLLP
jgi:hypothetical protein